MIPETKLDDSFLQVQLLIEGFYSPLRFDRNKTGSGILLYVREDIPAKILSHDFAASESFFVQIFFIKGSGSLTICIIRIRTVSKIILK